MPNKSKNNYNAEDSDGGHDFTAFNTQINNNNFSLPQIDLIILSFYHHVQTNKHEKNRNGRQNVNLPDMKFLFSSIVIIDVIRTVRML